MRAAQLFVVIVYRKVDGMWEHMGDYPVIAPKQEDALPVGIQVAVDEYNEGRDVRFEDYLYRVDEEFFATIKTMYRGAYFDGTEEED